MNDHEIHAESIADVNEISSEDAGEAARYAARLHRQVRSFLAEQLERDDMSLDQIAAEIVAMTLRDR